MHLVILTETFPPETDARASRISELAAAWAHEGVEVTVITRCPNFPKGKAFEGYRNEWCQRETWQGVSVLRVLSYIAPNQGFWPRMANYLSFMVSGFIRGLLIKKPDVVLATSPTLFSAMAAYGVARIRRRPFIFEIRDIWPEAVAAVGAMKDGAVLRLFKRIAAHLYKHAAHVTTVGQGYKSQLMEWYGVADERISIFANGILTSRFTPEHSPIEARQMLGLQENLRYVLYIGNHGPAQHLNTAIEAANLWRNIEGADDLRLLLVGDGAEKQRLIALAQDLGASDRCIFIDQTTKERVKLYYEACDAALVMLKDDPLFDGTYPSKIFEAMAMAKPVLCSVNGVSADLVEHAEAGLGLKAGDAELLARASVGLLANKAECEKMGHKGREYALKHHDRAVIAGEYLACLKGFTKPY